MRGVNGNGANNAEPVLSGWTIKLWKWVGGVWVFQTSMDTNASGRYQFNGLLYGDYKVNETIQAGWICTTPNAAGEYLFHVDSGFLDLDNDFGNFKLGKISGHKWNDLDGDGVWDGGEPALSGWNITLSGPVSGWVLTDVNGYYEFTGLTVGTYTVGEKLQADWIQTWPSAPGTYSIPVTSGTDSKDNDFGNQRPVKFVKEFSGSGALEGYTPPAISPDHLSSYVYATKTGPAIWWTVTYTVTNKDTVGHWYIVWDKWGGNLMVLNSTPTAFDPSTKMLTLKNGKSFKIDYTGYSGYMQNTPYGKGLVFTSPMNAEGLGTDTGIAYVTLHTGDQQQGTNPGKGKGTSKDGSSYDLDLRWEIGYLAPGQTATLTIIVAPGMNPGGQLMFTSTGISVINTGPVVRVYKDGTYADSAFMYTVPETNVLTVYVVTPKPWWAP